ncbi:hypothetical protein BC830DRAFT_1094171 [Chytriomyces sp. MP71]|nr:hypothetical protein BC830DRAFT_1094171 [Chytriomyces sp. MP71]
MAHKALVSGVSGYVGCHVARELLQQGFAVVGTVRSTEKGQQVRDALLKAGADVSKFEFAIVEDIAHPGCFDQVITSHKFDYVLHTASPFHYNVTDARKDLVVPAVRGTLEVIESVHKHGQGTVKRIVVTSSVAAIRSSPTVNPDGLSELDWNTNAVEAFEAQGSATPARIAYPASKTLAEQAAWQFKKDHPDASFDLVIINPPFIFGPHIHPCAKPDSLNTSVKMVYDFYTGTTKEVNPLMAAGCVDVRDVAKAHVLAIANGASGGNRFLVSSGPFTQEALVEVLKKRFPGREYATGTTTGVPVPELNRKSKEVLGMGKYIDFETSIVETVNALVAAFGNA